ncbi:MULTISPECIES: carbohydrate ABC transporter permease [Streptomyces]|uniref:Putative binding-protein-dependent transport system transmembrane subunit n=1 Tax=Streptomyces scabiei (strain 87.22) TaxID=680198 RepID=C9Z621_STRSW|nr:MULTISPECIES: carbohydrate ABC transporter permease [Streptomyces]MBP5866258.1 carbohydrate ABC transporter permease [Streptomyces sp. LBUM 1485]MBP5904980.1 carbohydrate ABC transporter permease [Streptomyces sp. LBUM 1478]MBP5932773.1 carbohydrate ABC transporter permease [Streptomyces sp. LBUM 1479]KFG07717.1 sugar ABC transporter permease [Streptomyces scabiei]MBP5918059.1 carbohydrate ABC transporter permease [Streptomyces sp. LBUM 1486]
MSAQATEITPAPAPSRTGALRRRLPGSLAWHLGSLAILAVILYPVIWVVGGSLKKSEDIVGSLDLLPSDPVVENYTRLADGIADIPISTFFLNSLTLAMGSVIGILVSCSLTAYAFSKIRFAGRNLLFTLMIGTLLLPYHVLLIPQYVLFRNMELINTYTPLLLPKYLATEAFFVFLMVQFMRNLPKELDEAARLDGCGHFRIYWSIVLPLCRPALITSAIFTFINSWNDFMGPLIYLNEPDKYTVSLGLKMFVDQDGVANYGGMIAMSLVALLPVLAFFLAFQRYLIDGMATSGLKG